MPALSSALSLAVLILLLFNEAATEGGCTEGFMDLSLLVAKAATPVGSLADNTLAESNEGRWIIGYNTSNCSNVRVTEVLFGADIRSEHGNRNKYPSIEIWRVVRLWWLDRSWEYYYSKLRTIPIALSPDNVTANGLYRYVLPTPFSIDDTYRLGVYQPEDDRSVVRLYNATTSSVARVGKIASSINDNYIKITGSNEEINPKETSNVFMIQLKTGMHCIHLIIS